MAASKVAKLPNSKGKSFLWNDFFLGLAITLNLGARLLTAFLENSISTLVKTANVLEANPASQKTITTNYYLTFALSMVLYAGLIVFYIYTRKGRNNSEYNMIAFNFFSALIAFAFASDFIGDLGIALAVILK
jgi:hypothetical protein